MTVGQERGEKTLHDLVLADDPLLHFPTQRRGDLRNAIEEREIAVFHRHA